MKNESEKFIFDRIDWNYQKSNKITNNRMSSGSTRAGVISASVCCKVCGESWESTSGGRPGKFSLATGTLLISCPGCGVQDAIPLRTLD
jgi:hypothetical protein